MISIYETSMSKKTTTVNLISGQTNSISTENGLTDQEK